MSEYLSWSDTLEKLRAIIVQHNENETALRDAYLAGWQEDDVADADEMSNECGELAREALDEVARLLNGHLGDTIPDALPPVAQTHPELYEILGG